MTVYKFNVSFEIRESNKEWQGKYVHVTKYENENKNDPILNGEVLSYQATHQANSDWMKMMLELDQEPINAAIPIKRDIIQKMHDAGIENGSDSEVLALIAQIEAIEHKNLEIELDYK